MEAKKQGRISNDQFLSEFAILLGKAQEKGSCFVTMKRCQDKEEVGCLVRAKYKGKKISTFVGSKDLVKFQIELSKCTKQFPLLKKPTKRQEGGDKGQGGAQKRVKD